MTAKKIRVVILSSGMPVPPTKGGAVETLIYETVTLYRDCDTTVYSEQETPEDMRPHQTPSLRFVQLRAGRLALKIQGFLNRIAKRGFLFGCYDYFFVRRAARAIGAAPDVLHIHNNFQYARYLRRRFPSTRLVLHMHNDFLFEYSNLRRQYTASIDAVDRVIAVSSYVGDRIAREYPACRGKVSVAHNGVSLKRFHKIEEGDEGFAKWRAVTGLPGKQRVVLYVGRIFEIKGVEVLARAFRRLCEERDDVRLIVVGTSWYAQGRLTPYMKRLDALFKTFHDRITFVGFISHMQLTYFYNSATVCCVPSIFNEPFGLVNLEAMASGCPVIASRIGGIPEIIRDGETGWLVPPKDADALYAKLKEVLDDDAARRRVASEALRHTRETGDWAHVAARYEQIYGELIR